MASRRAARLAWIFLSLGAVAPGCGGLPDRVEGGVRYRDPVTAKGRGGTVVTVTTRATRPTETAVTPEELRRLLGDLDEIGLFDLAGRETTPSPLPPGSISVDTNARKFFVTIQDLRNEDESRRFSRSAYRIVGATQIGPHYSLPK